MLKKLKIISLLICILVSFIVFGLAAQSPTEDLRLPGKLAIYYGQPSGVNGSNAITPLAAGLDAAAAVFSQYDTVILGDALQFPQPSTEPGAPPAPGEYPYYGGTTGCNQNRHFDHNNTVEIIKRLKISSKTKVYGYISIGGENTARHCDTDGDGIFDRPVPLTIGEVQSRVDDWKAMGVAGIFLDEAEYGFGASRERQNQAVDYIHSQGLSVFINGFNPDDIFSTEVVGNVTYTTGTLKNTLSSIPMNPTGAPAHLGSKDIYLLEHFQIINGNYVDPAAWASRSDQAIAYKAQYSNQVATVTTMSDSDPPASDCSQLFDQSKFDYAWWSTLLYGFDFMGWGEPLGFSAAGSCANRLPYHTRPDPGEIGTHFTGAVIHAGAVHTRTTTAGKVEVNTATHQGTFVSGTPSPTPTPTATAMPPAAELCRGLTPTIIGTADDDVLTGTSGPDVMLAKEGNDTIQGNDGDDVICGGPGYDEIEGGTGNDAVDAGEGDDYINGDIGNDTIDAGAGYDEIEGGGGNDRIHGDGDDDFLYGQGGQDLLWGDAGKDRVDGGAANDWLDGGADNDRLIGGTGVDTCEGGAGTDTAAGCETKTGVP